MKKAYVVTHTAFKVEEVEVYINIKLERSP